MIKFEPIIIKRGLGAAKVVAYIQDYESIKGFGNTILLAVKDLRYKIVKADYVVKWEIETVTEISYTAYGKFKDFDFRIGPSPWFSSSSLMQQHIPFSLFMSYKDKGFNILFTGSVVNCEQYAQKLIYSLYEEEIQQKEEELSGSLLIS